MTGAEHITLRPAAAGARRAGAVSDAERRALTALRMLQAADILEYVDCIASTRKENKGREKRLVGMLCALADARAALDA